MDEFYTEKAMDAGSVSPAAHAPARLHATPEPEKAARKVAAKKPSMQRGTVLNLLIGGGAIALFIFLLAAKPEVAHRVAITLDVFGISEEKKLEDKRQYSIMQLRIPHQEKLVLIEKKVFIGASTSVVPLALGNPLKVDYAEQDGKKLEIWTYQTPGAPESTVLTFTDQLLTKADSGPPVQ